MVACQAAVNDGLASVVAAAINAPISIIPGIGARYGFSSFTITRYFSRRDLEHDGEADKYFAGAHSSLS